ncbi:hypothetical protein TBLA_0I00960 [Henningerozyma blattae CBS 6284]|uniref:AP-1 complex subunit gamma n=1 Tax=Henningerozyma blattae (strain ATCC 34711 / CBS 6284 / DSM 70876 / NBRC 10599 / NRRL Y-10934 / UCD 77-7) TaxID=1071380 RepID=I2H8Q3_HENB6|nr:hypothetical protein TBLA_0I00960 [Tetrapisispora blattae CBS 6284]CCH62755.1 hypothetical protein TBLA_0I00960 [Tetrapisispora blattae CBS 6284]
MGSSLRSFIKDVRAAKTLADERSIITKQSAKIRTKLRDDHLPLERRRKYIQKLLYLYILGEKTHFGQVECINLIASDEFVNKRLGYLSAILLLDESQDLLTLLTNLLNNDLHNSNKFVVSLALSTLGSLSSPELARDLFPDVEIILKQVQDPFLLKKALQCIAKLLLKDISLLEIFAVEDLVALWQNSAICTHGVLLGIVKVLQSILLCFINFQPTEAVEELPKDMIGKLVRFVPSLFKRLQTLNSKNFQPEYDVQGTCDPFLQCEMIYTLRLFFQIDNDEINAYMDKFGDLLTQIATNTDSNKSSGQVILYETTRTIFSLHLDQPLRVLGINILAKFLAGKDNNGKYVALNTLLEVVPQEPLAVQRHRKFISRCLHDPDVSIKKRALELTFAILDASNIKELVNELLQFLDGTTDDDSDLIVYTVDHLVDAFDIHTIAGDDWKLSVFLRILKCVGSYISSEKISDILIEINNTNNMQSKHDAVKQLLTETLENEKTNEITDDNHGWFLVTVWCLGEYADLILGQSANNIVNEESLTRLLIELHFENSLDNPKLINYILTAALKLSIKLTSGKCIDQLRDLIVSHKKDSHLMLQVKSVQYEILFDQPIDVRKSILETMPKFEKVVRTTSDLRNRPLGNTPTKKESAKPDSLIDLLGGDFGSSSNNINSNENDSKANNVGDNINPETTDAMGSDLLADLLGGNNVNTSLSLNKAVSNSVELPSQAQKIHESSSLDIYSVLINSENGSAQIDIYFEAKKNVTDIKCQCAVTKTLKLTMGPLHPSASIKEKEISVQTLKISGSGKLKLRTKLDFKVNGIMTNEQFDHKYDKVI